jgi:hypothetical protein
LNPWSINTSDLHLPVPVVGHKIEPLSADDRGPIDRQRGWARDNDDPPAITTIQLNGESVDVRDLLESFCPEIAELRKGRKNG